MADLKKWEELDKFSKFKKSPIGYAPFVDVCLAKGKHDEAVKYLPRIADDIKFKYYVKANELDDAAQIAFEQRDMQGLLLVQSKCPPQSELSEKINSLCVQLRSRK
ncbi:PREDICTED: vacuolar protein sorting-associated protein 16 homolog [Nicrophorus vespilloides]|uniref:Vacuolar protein sorting-associated protein 16 homolog n=1 Tax=Nicrophorus vespilloides TaxID=110193 RepID=A0ABM1MI11_NICVS|nr:PREDICTED: vacuolar protein sorting-associated protein 16 homolog [Nicrophorus vespilloides]